MKPICTVLLATGLAALTATALAAEPFEKEIKARQGLMQLNGFYLGTLAAMAKGDRPYDAAAATAAAENLRLVSTIDDSTLWPKGSSAEDKAAKNAAKASMWATGSKMGDYTQAYRKAAADLAKAAGGGLDKLRPALGEMGKSCKSCHDDYRQKG